MTKRSRLRKRLLEAEATTSAGTEDEIEIVACATIAYSSENQVSELRAGSARVLIRSSTSLWNLTSRSKSRGWCTKLRRPCENGPKKSASRSPKMEVKSIAQSWFRNITLAPGEPRTSAKNCASTVFRPADCV